MSKTKTISVVGLGKLGACTAACFAYKGFNIIGVDINQDSVDAINNKKAPVYEPRLQELISAQKGRFQATQDCEEAIKESDITFLIVPTPSRPDGHFSDEYLGGALRQLSLALKKSKKDNHLFVITSTVSPGATQESLIPLIESVSDRKLNDGFEVCYNPEFIALGSVITDFLNADLVLIGESNKVAGDKLEEIYKIVCESKPYIGRMSIISAEITKISLNSFTTTKISFANTLANLCEAIPGSNIDDITRALGSDKRISPLYLKGGPSYGGPCFPRDNRAFAAFAKKYGVDAKLAKTTDEINQFQTNHLIEKICKCIAESNQKTVSILGLSYKPNTPVIDESPAIKIIEELIKKKDIEIAVYDPLAMNNAKKLFGDRIIYAPSTKDCFRRSSVCIITTQLDEFENINESYIVNNPTVVIDCWRMLNPQKLGKRVRYAALGICAGKIR